MSIRLWNVAAFILCVMPLPALAQNTGGLSRDHAQHIATSCIGHWSEPTCMSAVSESNMILAAAYGGALQQRSQDAAAENIKQHCAASTAAREGQYPAYAMKSAFTECANMMYDISEQTGLAPDQSRYQVLVAAVLCMGNDPKCAAFEEGLKPYAQ